MSLINGIYRLMNVDQLYNSDDDLSVSNFHSINSVRMRFGMVFILFMFLLLKTDPSALDYGARPKSDTKKFFVG